MRTTHLYRRNTLAVLCCAMLLLLSFSSSRAWNTCEETKENKNISAITHNEYFSDISFPEIQCEFIKAEDTSLYERYSFPNCQYTQDPGLPQIPYKQIKIQVPSNARDIQVEILRFNEHYKSPAFPLLPTPDTVFVQDNVGTIQQEVFAQDETFYTTFDGFYPDTIVEIAERVNIRGFTYVVLNVFPVQYHPLKQHMKIIDDLHFRVYWTMQDVQTSLSITPPFLELLEGIQLVNFNRPLVQSFPSLYPQVIYPTNLANPGNSAEYLIITADGFYDSSSLRDFATYKNRYQRLNVAVVNTSLVYSAYGGDIPVDPELNDTGSNLDLQMKTFIKYAYEHWDNGYHRLQYILLVGDGFPESTNYYLPVHPTIFTSNNQTIVTDYWYSCINDDTNDGCIDDNDSAADLFLGRFSVKTQDSLEAVVQKTMRYGLSPSKSQLYEWGSRILLTNGFVQNDSDMNYLSRIRDDHALPHKFEVTYVDANQYDDPYQEAIDEVKTQINRGHGLFIHNSHGSVYTWSFGLNSGGTHFRPEDVDDLNNTNRLPIIFSLSCQTGAFDNSHECLGETFVNTRAKGAVAFLGSTRDSFAFQNYHLIDGIMSALLDSENYILGSCINAGKLTCDKNNRFMYTLFGDPSLNLSAVLCPSKKPELACSLNSYKRENQTIHFNLVVSNNGLDKAADVLVELFVNNPFEEGQLVEDATHLITMDSESVLQYSVAVPLQEEWHRQPFYLIVDRAEQIDELYEENNISPPLIYYEYMEVDAHGPYECQVNTSLGLIGSAEGGQQPYDWSWNFGDGTMLSYEQNPTHTYTAAGEYNATLTVTDVDGQSEHATAQVIVFSRPTIVYVDDDYNESTPGWKEDHFGTMEEAIDRVDWTGTVYVYTGTYYPSLLLIEKPIRLIGEDKNTTVINGENNDIHIRTNDVTISQFTLLDYVTIGFFGASHCLFADTIITHDHYAPEVCLYLLQNSNNNTIARNILSNYSYAIRCCDSSDNIISDNVFYTINGIMTWSSSRLIIENNSFHCPSSGVSIDGRSYTICYNVFKNGGIEFYDPYAEPLLSYWNTHTIEQNTLNNRTLLYLKNAQNVLVQQDISQLLLANCTNVTVQNISFENVSTALQLGFTTGSRISNCTFFDNKQYSMLLLESSGNVVERNIFTHHGEEDYNSQGCLLLYTDNCRISENVFSNLTQGIATVWGQNNLFYHNNFIHNNWHVYSYGSDIWNLSYPDGGNYWDDYTGVDENGDGIGDSPYPIFGGGFDYYPFMETNGWERLLKE